MAIDGQVCFHGRPFADPVRPCRCIAGPVGPLGSTNQNWLCIRLLPMIVSVYPVVCVHSRCLLGTQHYCMWPNGRECLHPSKFTIYMVFKYKYVQSSLKLILLLDSATKSMPVFFIGTYF